MSKGYWLAIYRAIHDQDQLAKYAKKATVAIAEHGGTFLSRGMPEAMLEGDEATRTVLCLLYTSPSPRDQRGSRMPSSA